MGWEDSLHVPRTISANEFLGRLFLKKLFGAFEYVNRPHFNFIPK